MRFTRAKSKRQAIVTAIQEFDRQKRMAELIKHAGTCKDFISVEDLSQQRRKGRSMILVDSSSWIHLLLQGTLSKLTLSATDQRVYGGSRLHLRDDWPRTPSGPEGSSGRGFKSGAEVLLARAASQKACDNTL